MRGNPDEGLFKPPTYDFTGVCCARGGGFLSSVAPILSSDAVLATGVKPPSKLP